MQLCTYPESSDHKRPPAAYGMNDVCCNNFCKFAFGGSLGVKDDGSQSVQISDNNANRLHEEWQKKHLGSQRKRYQSPPCLEVDLAHLCDCMANKAHLVQKLQQLSKLIIIILYGTTYIQFHFR